MNAEVERFQLPRNKINRLNGCIRVFVISLIHFHPQGWSIEEALIEEVVEDIIEVIGLIADDPYPFRHMEESDREMLDSKIEEIREIIRKEAKGRRHNRPYPKLAMQTGT